MVRYSFQTLHDHSWDSSLVSFKLYSQSVKEAEKWFGEEIIFLMEDRWEDLNPDYGKIGLVRHGVILVPSSYLHSFKQLGRGGKIFTWLFLGNQGKLLLSSRSQSML